MFSLKKIDKVCFSVFFSLQSPVVLSVCSVSNDVKQPRFVDRMTFTILYKQNGFSSTWTRPLLLSTHTLE